MGVMIVEDHASNSYNSSQARPSPTPSNGPEVREDEDSDLDDDVVDSKRNLLPSAGDNRIKRMSGDSTRSSNHECVPGTVVVNTSADEIPNWRKYFGVAILFFINLLNYMDRYTIAGVLIQIQDFFQINNAMAGLLQTVFIISYMLVAPIFGYLGDRYNRIVIIVFGMLLWSSFTLAASFIDKPSLFPVFLLMRGLVGIGEASYSTIAPTLIGDLFVGPQRTRMLSVFFFATPIGSGLGYIVGSQVAAYMGSWEWALRVTPGLGLIAIVLLVFFCPNPPRGASETKNRAAERNTHSYTEDLKYLMVNKSFIYVTVGFTFMAFVMGSLTLWGPTYFAYSQMAVGALPPCDGSNCDYKDISFVFGIIACVSGFSGVGIGAEWARRWKLSGQKNADPIVCGIGLLAGAPLLMIGTHITLLSVTAAWVFVFFADLSLCLTWTLIGDMTLYVCEPSRRSTANAVMLLVGHLFGDAGSPYLLGIIADSLMENKPESYMQKYLTLQQAMYLTLFACVVGGWGFLMASVYIVKDKEKVDRFLNDSDSAGSTRTTNSNESNASIPMSVRGKVINESIPAHSPVLHTNGHSQPPTSDDDDPMTVLVK